jgi:hypothetical protein
MKAKLSLLKLSLIALFILSGCGNMFSKNKTKFDWLAQESAPREFPMRVINGTFYYHGQSRGLYIPTAAKIGYLWGEGESIHVVGEDFKALPDRLDIRFYSFWENKLYRGSFDLPYERILALFKEGVARDKERPIFDRVVVGMAPGGTIAVWVGGRETREVFFGQAEPYDAEISDPLGSPIENKQEYAESYLQDLPVDIYTRIKQEGVPFGIWERYRKTYPWSFSSAPDKKVSSFGVSFYNGESYPIATPFALDHASKPTPLSISFIAVFPGDNTQYVYSIGFDFPETSEVLEKLAANGKKINLIIDPKLPENTSTISLSNGEETIELKKIIHK